MNYIDSLPMARRDRDGMAVIGRTVNAMRGLRYEEGEDDTDQIADPQGGTVVSVNDLSEQISTRDAKIAELTAEIESLGNTIVERDAEIVSWKAKNYDLVLQIPATSTIEDVEDNDDIGDSDIDLDNDEDLFGKD